MFLNHIIICFLLYKPISVWELISAKIYLWSGLVVPLNDTKWLVAVTALYGLDHAMLLSVVCDNPTRTTSLQVCVAGPRLQWQLLHCMMTSSNWNIFRVTGHLWGEFTGHRWIPLAKISDAALWCFLWSVPEQTIGQIIETPVIMTSRYWQALS